MTIIAKSDGIAKSERFSHREIGGNVWTERKYPYFCTPEVSGQAQMAESVDALVSNTSRFTPVSVRPRLWVQNNPSQKEGFLFFSKAVYLRWILLWCIFQLLQCTAKLVRAGSGLAAAPDAVEFADDIVHFLPGHQAADSLQIAVTAAVKENLLYHIVLIDRHIDKL